LPSVVRPLKPLPQRVTLTTKPPFFTVDARDESDDERQLDDERCGYDRVHDVGSLTMTSHTARWWLQPDPRASQVQDQRPWVNVTLWTVPESPRTSTNALPR
jgi:hypothetical protein